LIEALDGDDPRIRRHAMQLLGLIRDPRGREPLIAMLVDRDPPLRETAARCLARFPSSDSTCALERLLRNEAEHDVRVAAVHALVELYDAGREEALRPVLNVLFDPDEEARLRIAAFALLPRLQSKERRSVLKRLRADPSEEVAEAAALESRSHGQAAPAQPSMKALLEDLGSRDYGVWNEAVRALASRGAEAVEPVVRAMCAHAKDPEYCTRAGMALKAMGPRKARGLADAIEDVDEPVPLQVLVDVIGALGVNAMIYRLKDVIERSSNEPVGRAGAGGRELARRVRAKAHLELARIGSRVAIHDLRAALTDSGGRLELEMLAAVELIGKRDEIPDLLRAHRREDPFVRERIERVVRSIMKRERIRRNSLVVRSLGEEQQRTLLEILDRPKRTTRRAPRRKRPSR
jgi:HEAT repeat protein